MTTLKHAGALGGLLLLLLASCQPSPEESSTGPGLSARPATSGTPDRSSSVVPLPLDRPGVLPLELVAQFWDAMPTGVAVAAGGRIFVAFPRWGDPVPFTVAEVKEGKPVPFPGPAVNTLDLFRPADHFISAESVVVDPRNRLWVLDSGSVKAGPVLPGGAKLVCVDLSINRIVKVISFPSNVVLPTSHLADLRFDLRKGSGTAYLTDSSREGPNGIVVVDLATGQSRRRLEDHPSTKAEARFLPFVEGRELRIRLPGRPEQYLSTGSLGIALGPDGRRLFYCPLAGRRLYSVDTDALQDDSQSDEQVARTVRDEGMKPASAGLESDTEGRIYVTAYEINSIVRRAPDGRYETLVHDPRVLWPDRLALAEDGTLYFIVNQLHRQKDYTGDQDQREKPYALFRVRTDGAPVRLR